MHKYAQTHTDAQTVKQTDDRQTHKHTHTQIHAYTLLLHENRYDCVIAEIFLS